MKNIIKKISVFSCVFILLIQSTEHVSAANEKIIRRYENGVGNYYGVDINEAPVVNEGIQNNKNKEALHYEMPLENTLQALPLLSALGQQLGSFEVLQGSMDEAFLNIIKTGEEANP